MRKFYFLPILLVAFCSIAQNQTDDWTALKIIDIHAHIGSFRDYDLSLQTLRENMQKYGIALALISNINAAELRGITPNSNEVDANEETARIISSEPERFRGLVWVRPNDGSPKTIEPFLTKNLPDGSRLFVGMKFHPEMNHFQADDSRLDEYLKLCEKYNIPAVFHSGKPSSNSSPDRIYSLARRHPYVPIILYHMVAFGPHEPAIDTVRMALAKRDANLYLETAQADPDAVIRAIRELGSSRVLFGTDATYYGKNHYSHYEKLIRRLQSELNSEDLNAVLNGNARKLFRLE